MGRISAVFKSDEDETQSRYSVSEWWLEPKTRGPGAHSHAEDDLVVEIKSSPAGTDQDARLLRMAAMREGDFHS